MTDDEVLALNDMSMSELRAMWQEYFGRRFNTLNRKFYIYRLAYRMQEIAYGSVSNTIREELLNYKLPVEKPKSKMPLAGTKLTREYRGTEYVCTVLRNGFEYQGMYYKSLSAVAKEITGLSISGTFFFNLNKGGKKNG